MSLTLRWARWQWAAFFLGLAYTTGPWANALPALFFLAFLWCIRGEMSVQKNKKSHLLLALIALLALWPASIPLLGPAVGASIKLSEPLRLVAVGLALWLMSRRQGWLSPFGVGTACGLAAGTLGVLWLQITRFHFVPAVHWPPLFSWAGIFGAYAVFTLPWSILALRRHYWLSLLLLASTLTCVLLTYASTAYIAFGCQVILFLIWFWQRGIKSGLKATACLILVALLTGCALSLATQADPAMRTRLHREWQQLTSHNLSEFSNTRTEVWRVSKLLIANAPLTGHGWDKAIFLADMIRFAKTQPNTLHNPALNQPHNSVLQAAYMGGWGYACLYILLMIASGTTLLLRWINKSQTFETPYVSAAWLAVVVAGLAESFVAPPYVTFELSWFNLLLPLFWRPSCPDSLSSSSPKTD